MCGDRHHPEGKSIFGFSLFNTHTYAYYTALDVLLPIDLGNFMVNNVLAIKKFAFAAAAAMSDAGKYAMSKQKIYVFRGNRSPLSTLTVSLCAVDEPRQMGKRTIIVLFSVSQQ